MTNRSSFFCLLLTIAALLCLSVFFSPLRTTVADDTVADDTVADDAVADDAVADDAVADDTPAVIEGPEEIAANEDFAVPAFQTVGVMSCSASACHGTIWPDDGRTFRPAARGIRRDEFIAWRQRDPHADAAADLYNGRSQRILLNLGALQKDGAQRVSVTDRYSTTMQQCFGCHNPGVKETPHEFPAAVSIADGVSCEACHGPASQWRTLHYQRDWSRMDAKTKSAHGMRNIDNLLIRARVCAECHVGSPGMEVNHDLIAAGHPALKFEFTSYLDYLPKHWNEQRERAVTPDFELRSWLAGQIACSESALDLLAARTAPYDPKLHPHHHPVFPEFAEYDCFACHYDLNYPSWRIERGFGDRRRGQLAWGSWYFKMARHLAADSKPGGAAYVEALDALSGQMSDSMSTVNRQQVHDQAENAAQKLADWIRESGLSNELENQSAGGRGFEPFKTNTLRSVSSALQKNEGAAAIESWDTATQAYLWLVMLNQGRRDAALIGGHSQADPAVLDMLREIRGSLRFPTKRNTDRPGTTLFDSPQTFPIKRGSLGKAIHAAQTQLKD